MEEKKEQKSIRDEIKGYVTMSGWLMKDVAEKLSKKKSKVASQNLSNKLTNGTIKYSEVKKIAELTGYEIIWKKK